MLRKILGKFQPLLYKGIKWYYAKPRWVKKRGLKIRLYPTVFHPGFYLSTDIMLDYLLTLSIDGKSLLELGAGSGLVALYLAKNKNCKVTATDINPNAIKGLEENSQTNQVDLKVIASDLFDAVPFEKLDYIIVNPPYYAGEISAVDEYAFYAGTQLEYFSKFYSQIVPYLKNDTTVYMILSETAPLAKIKMRGEQEKIKMKTVYSKRKIGEFFFIYQLYF